MSNYKDEVHLKVQEKIYPPEDIVKRAWIKDYDEVYKRSIEDREGFWAEVAEELHWFRKWDKVLEWNFPYAKWFVGGKTNITYNALDRHIKNGKGDKIAYIYVDEDGNEEKVTYSELLEKVNALANGLKRLGLKKGDRVSIYMPNSIEAVVSMLACARIGVIHSVVFAGFSEGALHMRIDDAKASAVITATYTKRRGRKIPLLPTVEKAIKDLDYIKNVIVWDRDKEGVTDKDDKYVDLNRLIEENKGECSPEEMDSEDPLFILYTSGTTGKPKGVLHTTGGYMVNTYYTAKIVFDLHEDDIYWCTADIGWITGHSYIVYAPLTNGVTSVIMEGVPVYPHPGIWWEYVDKYRVNIFYTAPTAIRMLMRFGDEIPAKYDLSSLRILGSVGEPINPEAWHWYYEHIGRKRCVIVDTWWQTETGSHMITTIPSYPMKPGKAGKPFFTIEAAVVDKNGNELPPNTVGYLVIKNPWPSMLRTCWGNPERYEKYWKEIDNVYNADDLASIDEDGYIMIVGRADDVLSVAGHRIGTMEVESAIVEHPDVVEAAVIGKPDPIKGQKIKAFVVLKVGVEPSDQLKKEIQNTVREILGPIAIPEEIDFVDKLPKTRSGKIMRRVLRAQELGLEVGDLSTLED
ncbi:MAG TPA: acetate--CoA ligase [Persephonella sp.]|uniref:Acetate--CoA ligase n=1 Tax=Persephonella marina (strain DSM 14350 / EX-H1) TaxID=123214 RepID=C0QUM1_PERMH|nr:MULTISPECIES: acetate--CoA ligase [Persephonella]ACO04826.1 acetate--CoA ligase [Persephonella marina EX-H1]HCB69997.1 acetate--CoA ligase [Persephonella sp.]